MEHYFNVEIAKVYGIEEAIFIHNMFFWIKKNVANNRHKHDGRYWTYNSSKAFAELFPYFNEKKIYRLLADMCQKKILIKGNFNKNAFDRTMWYSLSDELLYALDKEKYDVSKMSDRFDEIKKNHFPKTGNPLPDSGEPIPYSKPNIKTDKEEKEDKSSSKKTYDLSFVDGKYMSTFTEWLEYKAERKEKYKTESSLKACYNRLLKLSGDNPQIAAEIVQQSIANNYAGLFEYKEMRAQKPKPKTQEEINREKLTMPILNEEGDLPDGTFFKNGKRWYFSKQEGRAASCAPDASPRPNDRAEYDWTIKDWRVPRDKWEASDEIW